MIKKECFTAEWIEQVSSELHYNDKNLIEKVIRALSLLEMLVKAGCPLVFKGGTALMLILGKSAHRLSIDIDLICPPGTNIEDYLKSFADFGFINLELVERKQRDDADIPKSHSKFFYQIAYRNDTDAQSYILLDVLYEDIHYFRTQQIAINCPFIRLEGKPLMVTVPSAEDILGDKLTAFNWSGGKDSAHALWRARQSELYDIVALLTTINRDSQRSSMHGIPLPLLQAQADSIGIPLHIVNLTPQGNLENYAEAMTCAALHFKEQGVTHFIFGDIYLHDVRAYRERQLAPLGIEVVEPLWGVVSSEIVMQQYLASGLKTVIVTTQADGLGMDAIGREVDADFIASLPKEMDHNGENGEYHTFCYDGPIFSSPVLFRLGTPFSQSYDIRLEDGTIQTYTYCFAHLSAEP